MYLRIKLHVSYIDQLLVLPILKYNWSERCGDLHILETRERSKNTITILFLTTVNSLYKNTIGTGTCIPICFILIEIEAWHE